MRVSLIITTYNRPDALAMVLESVNIQSIRPDEIIIADDGSDNSTKKCIVSFQNSSSLRVLHSWQEDKGFRAAKSRNKAIALSSSQYIILVDGDVILHKNFIEDHINNAESGFFIQGTRVLLSNEASKKTLKKNKIDFSFFQKGLKNRKNLIRSVYLSRLFSKKGVQLTGIKTCNLSFYKLDAIKINGFNNNIEGWGREDSDFAVRLLNSGVNRKNVRFSLVQYHLWHQPSKKIQLPINNSILQESIDKKLKWCENGLKKYL
jgi:glycosyltransferase involved in cell wall biosynthesis